MLGDDALMVNQGVLNALEVAALLDYNMTWL